MKNNLKILILGLTNKSGLAVARNLCKSGCDVHAILFDDVAAKHSRYITKSFYLGNPEHNVEKFNHALIRHITENKYDVLIPIHDGALEVTRLIVNDISAFVNIAGLNEDNIYKYSIDKSELLSIGQKHGLIIPSGNVISSLDKAECINFSKLKFPVVAKPVSSAKVYHNKLMGFSVKICHNEKEVIDFVRENIWCTSILIQEYIQGYGIGYNFISKNGIILNDYIHRRINEFKGVSTLRESLPPDKYDIRDKVKKMISDIGWNGVGMVEFKIMPDNTPVLMEFNGRFFGSTELSVYAGINLPDQFLKAFIINEEVERINKIKHCSVRYLHDEVLQFTQMLFKLKTKDFFKWFLGLMVSFFKRNSFIEDSIFKDPSFVFALYIYDLKRYYKKVKLSLIHKLIKIKPLNVESLHGVRNITFVCYGNICRSPFARLYAAKINHEYIFDSCGFVLQEDRMPPTNAVLAAKKFDIDLSCHTSKSLFSIDVHNVDLFIVMDKMNSILLRRNGITEKKIRFICSNEIRDPYGKELSAFEDNYESIKEAMDRLFLPLQRDIKK